jgi:hypothetical protein
LKSAKLWTPPSPEQNASLSVYFVYKIDKIDSFQNIACADDTAHAIFVTAHRVSAMKKGSIRALPLEETLEGVYKHRVGTLFLDTAGLPAIFPSVQGIPVTHK